MDPSLFEIIKIVAPLIFGGLSGSAFGYWLGGKRERIKITREVIADLEERRTHLAEVRGLLVDGRTLDEEQRNDVTALGDKFDSVARQYYEKVLHRKVFDAEVHRDFMCSFLGDVTKNEQFRGNLVHWKNLKRYCDEH